MREYGAQGTLGDVYIHLCRLYRPAVIDKDKIKVHHWTRHHFWHPKIEELYKMLPNVEVNFLGKKNGHKGIERLPFTPFPDLQFATDISRHNLPKEYMAMTVKTGRHSQKKRSIKPFIVEWIIEDYEDLGLPIVLLGDKPEDAGDNYTTDKPLIDLRGKTTLREAFEIIKRAKEFVGFQGMLCFVACSQKVLTTIYYATDTDLHAVKENVLQTEWKNYVMEVIQI